MSGTLKKNYTNLKSEIAYSGIKNIYDYYQGVLSVKQIEDFLSTNYAYTRHKQTKKLRRGTNPTFKYFNSKYLYSTYHLI